MWRSGLFWRLFSICGVVWLAMIGLLAAVDEPFAGKRPLLWMAAAVAGLAALLLAFWLAQRIAHPILDLTRAAEQIAHGNFAHKVYANNGDEVGQLTQAFNRMTERLAIRFAQLEEDRQQLRTVLSGMVEGVIALDAGQRILFANERAAQLLDFQAPSAVGRKLWEVIRLRALQDVVRRALGGTEPVHEELTIAGAAPRSLTVHAASLPDGPARGAVLVLHDTSDLRRLERLRQEFVTNVSHELKTPLSIIKACVETLIDGAADDPTHRGPFLERIDEQADRLHTLILDLLSLARIESGEQVFDLQSIPIEPIVAACLERHRARAEGKTQQLEVHPPVNENATAEPQDREPGNLAIDPRPANLPLARAFTALAVWADEEAVSEILDNLVDNAVKYTPDGGRIAVSWRAEDDQVCLEVADSGIGIPEADLPRVFERFYRVDKARSRELGGTGLGLSIVKHLVQAMNGSIIATSKLGQGTTFSVRLPKFPAA
jgi:two-component system, OmpR family, phosphate regulon sensor histidine kinase PhoR